MDIQFNTDNQIDGDAAMQARAREIVEGALARFAARLTRVELHLADENSPAKGGSADIRCTMEAAMRGAARKLARALDSEFGKLDDRR